MTTPRLNWWAFAGAFLIVISAPLFGYERMTIQQAVWAVGVGIAVSLIGAR